MNGVEDEGKRLVAEIRSRGADEGSPDSAGRKIEKVDEEPVLVGREGEESDVTQYSDEEKRAEVKEEGSEGKPKKRG